MRHKFNQMLCCIGVILVFCAPAFASPEKKALKNGIIVILNKDTLTPIIAVSLFVRNGSSYETAENNGVTNLASELLVKGTLTRSAAEFAEEIEALGASLDTAGGEDFSTVSLVSVKKHLPKALDLMTEALLTPSFKKEELDKVRKDISASLKSREDRSFDFTYSKFKEIFYAGHCYRLDKLGSLETLSKLTREQVLTAYKAGLKAPRIVMAVSGNYPADIMEMLENRFGGIEAKDDGALCRGSTVFKLEQNSENVIKRDKSQSMLILGYPAPSIKSADFPAVKVLSGAIGGGMSSKLFVELREKQGLAYEIGAFSPSRVNDSHFIFYAGTRKENIEKLKAGLFLQVENIRAGKALTEEDITAAKNYIVGNFYLDKQTNAKKAWYLAWYESAGKGYAYIDGYAEAISGVTPADINKITDKYFNKHVLTIMESN